MPTIVSVATAAETAMGKGGKNLVNPTANDGPHGYLHSDGTFYFFVFDSDEQLTNENQILYVFRYGSGDSEVVLQATIQIPNSAWTFVTTSSYQCTYWAVGGDYLHFASAMTTSNGADTEYRYSRYNLSTDTLVIDAQQVWTRGAETQQNQWISACPTSDNGCILTVANGTGERVMGNWWGRTAYICINPGGSVTIRDDLVQDGQESGNLRNFTVPDFATSDHAWVSGQGNSSINGGNACLYHLSSSGVLDTSVFLGMNTTTLQGFFGGHVMTLGSGADSAVYDVNGLQTIINQNTTNQLVEYGSKEITPGGQDSLYRFGNFLNSGYVSEAYPAYHVMPDSPYTRWVCWQTTTGFIRSQYTTYVPPNTTIGATSVSGQFTTHTEFKVGNTFSSYRVQLPKVLYDDGAGKPMLGAIQGNSSEGYEFVYDVMMDGVVAMPATTLTGVGTLADNDGYVILDDIVGMPASSLDGVAGLSDVDNYQIDYVHPTYLNTDFVAENTNSYLFAAETRPPALDDWYTLVLRFRATRGQYPRQEHHLMYKLNDGPLLDGHANHRGIWTQPPIWSFNNAPGAQFGNQRNLRALKHNVDLSRYEVYTLYYLPSTGIYLNVSPFYQGDFDWRAQSEYTLDSLDADAPTWQSCCVLSDDNGTVIVLYDGNSKSLRYRVSTDHGASFASEVDFASGVCNNAVPVLFDGTMGYITGTGGGQVQYVEWNGSGFDSPVTISSGTDGNGDYGIDVATDETNGKLLVAWVRDAIGGESGTHSVVYTEYNGAMWLTPEFVAESHSFAVCGVSHHNGTPYVAFINASDSLAGAKKSGSWSVLASTYSYVDKGTEFPNPATTRGRNFVFHIHNSNGHVITAQTYYFDGNLNIGSGCINITFNPSTDTFGGNPSDSGNSALMNFNLFNDTYWPDLIFYNEYHINSATTKFTNTIKREGWLYATTLMDFVVGSKRQPLVCTSGGVAYLDEDNFSGVTSYLLGRATPQTAYLQAGKYSSPAYPGTSTSLPLHPDFAYTVNFKFNPRGAVHGDKLELFVDKGGDPIACGTLYMGQQIMEPVQLSTYTAMNIQVDGDSYDSFDNEGSGTIQSRSSDSGESWAGENYPLENKLIKLE